MKIVPKTVEKLKKSNHVNFEKKYFAEKDAEKFRKKSWKFNLTKKNSENLLEKILKKQYWIKIMLIILKKNLKILKEKLN